MKNKKKNAILFLGMSLGLGFSGWLYVIFLRAFYSGIYIGCININVIGEANSEFIIIPIMLFIQLIAWIILLVKLPIYK